MGAVTFWDMASLPNALPRLQDDPTGRAFGLELPPGALVDTVHEGSWHEPLLWLSAEPVGFGDWGRASAARRAVGLLPVLIADPDGKGADPAEWGLMPDRMSYPGDHDADDVLAEYWAGLAEDGPGESGTGGHEEPPWRGLAAGSDEFPEDPDSAAREFADMISDGDGWLGQPRLALVPARRSADIPAVIGWSGPLNHDNDVARLCAVMRSWEDRFGTRIVALTYDQLVISVAAPPRTQEAAEALAAEHFAFCPDNLHQSDTPGIAQYARERLLDQYVWSFWWD